MIKVSETLYEAIKNFLNFSPQVASHMENKENPHEVTKEQVGLGNVTNSEQATKAELTAHTSASNPHGITKTKVGLSNVDNVQQATKTEFTAHKNSTSNPHGVTKAQIGLSDVDNIKQAEKAKYDAHIAGTADKHSGDDIMYSASKSVSQKIDELIVEGGGGTMYHDELLNRSLSGAHPIEAITGLRGQIGETIVFGGTTTTREQQPTQLMPEGTSAWLSERGRIVIPENTAVSLDVTVTGVKVDSGEIVYTAGGMWHTKAIAARGGENKSVKLVTDDYTVLRLKDDETDSEAIVRRQTQDDGVEVVVRGIDDTTMVWKAEVKITNMLTVD